MRARTASEKRIQESLKGAFTRYIQGLVDGVEPTRDAFDEVWEALEAGIRHELRRRNLWTSPPSYLGVFGYESWQRAEALDELLVDAFADIFVRRLKRLQAALERHSDVEGLVFRCLRNFIHDRQKDNDPLGYRLFEVLHDAVKASLLAGELYRVGAGTRIRNDTVLSTVEGASLPGAENLRPIVARWNDDLLPDLVTAGGGGRPRVVERLRRRLLSLAADGVQAFRFGNLLASLKDDVRSRWAQLFNHEEGESVPDNDGDRVQLIRIFHPEKRAEDMHDFKRLVNCVSSWIEKADIPGRGRHDLETLWGFLRRYAVDEGPESLPSNRKMAELLRIPRRLFPSLYENIGRAVVTCQSALAGKLSEDINELQKGTS